MNSFLGLVEVTPRDPISYLSALVGFDVSCVPLLGILFCMTTLSSRGMLNRLNVKGKFRSGFYYDVYSTETGRRKTTRSRKEWSPWTRVEATWPGLQKASASGSGQAPGADPCFPSLWRRLAAEPPLVPFPCYPCFPHLWCTLLKHSSRGRLFRRHCKAQDPRSQPLVVRFSPGCYPSWSLLPFPFRGFLVPDQLLAGCTILFRVPRYQSVAA